ncbi:TetR family transcriptional regulator [Mycobacterium florentinum]|uniref:TetR family transcriptional regulator n=1 Tax=Mycobacterium florentinum TaxID=292462 RepID=A0A1X1UGU2_MYCFL|nr:TetR-like C-terminal domain-containing protein [Mycobacterium florentinum]MCV7412783.1 TetR/AcrR family transcriptional regulator C-terminal ligand-binding domain-containing protein [Mycobacterium florentinum]ORV56050.1 TetR family transcriptional regulator [Mycobacterium florentinum]BBX76288.1 TetR family transcriptional regulator [Mycobacterium florentinum]
MPPDQPPEDAPGAVPADIRAQVMPAVLDELARWGVERFSVEALAERYRLDAGMIYRHWGDRQRLIVDAALADLETWGEVPDTGSLRGDLEALALGVGKRINSEVGRAFLRALVMGPRGRHDEETRIMFWRARFAVVRQLIDRARKRGELRDGITTVAATQILLAPINIRALYSDAAVDDEYCLTVADMAYHAIARH